MRRIALAGLAGLAPLIPVPAGAACRLALVLALDVSASVSPYEFSLQNTGLARALLAPEIRQSLLAQPDAPVALTVFQWSSTPHQSEILPWTIIDSAERLDQAAARIAAHPRGGLAGHTALGAALAHAGELLGRAPPCVQQTVDVSGDGRNNLGPTPAAIGPTLKGVTINALAIGGDKPLDNAGGSGPVETLTSYYTAQVIRGPGAFVEVADNYADFEAAMRRKLHRELGNLVIGRSRPPEPRP